MPRDLEKQKAWKRKNYAENREKYLARNKVWFEKNPEKHKENMRKNYLLNRKEHIVKAAAWRKNNMDKARKSAREGWRRKAKFARERALLTIMSEHNHFGCQYKIHPNMPESLKRHECWGDLWLEHPNGGGTKETNNGRINKWAPINSGKASAKKYMVLCQLHQLWNNRSASGLSQENSEAA